MDLHLPPQGYKHSLTLAYKALAKLLEAIKDLADKDHIGIIQYIDDIFIQGDDYSKVLEVGNNVIALLEEMRVQVPEGKRQEPSSEVAFLISGWREGP